MQQSWENSSLSFYWCNTCNYV